MKNDHITQNQSNNITVKERGRETWSRQRLWSEVLAYSLLHLLWSKTGHNGRLKTPKHTHTHMHAQPQKHTHTHAHTVLSQRTIDPWQQCHTIILYCAWQTGVIIPTATRCLCPWLVNTCRLGIFIYLFISCWNGSACRLSCDDNLANQMRAQGPLHPGGAHLLEPLNNCTWQCIKSDKVLKSVLSITLPDTTACKGLLSFPTSISIQYEHSKDIRLQPQVNPDPPFDTLLQSKSLELCYTCIKSITKCFFFFSASWTQVSLLSC